MDGKCAVIIKSRDYLNLYRYPSFTRSVLCVEVESCERKHKSGPCTSAPCKAEVVYVLARWGGNLVTPRPRAFLKRYLWACVRLCNPKKRSA